MKQNKRELDTMIARAKRHLKQLEMQKSQRDYGFEHITQKDRDKLEEIQYYMEDACNWVFEGYSDKYKQKYQVMMDFSLYSDYIDVVNLKLPDVQEDSLLDLLIDVTGQNTIIEIGEILISEDVAFPTVKNRWTKMYKEFWEIHERFPFLEPEQVFSKNKDD